MDKLVVNWSAILTFTSFVLLSVRGLCYGKRDSIECMCFCWNEYNSTSNLLTNSKGPNLSNSAVHVVLEIDGRPAPGRLTHSGRQTSDERSTHLDGLQRDVVVVLRRVGGVVHGPPVVAAAAVIWNDSNRWNVSVIGQRSRRHVCGRL